MQLVAGPGKTIIGNRAIFNQAGGWYYGPAFGGGLWGVAESDARIYVPFSGLVKNLHLRAYCIAAGMNVSATLILNGVDTVLTCGHAFSDYFSADLLHQFRVLRGDTLTIKAGFGGDWITNPQPVAVTAELAAFG